jgi:regulator of PEP synthase PpsR (kinase-PPPase family)
MLNLTKALDNAGHKNHVALVSSLDDMESAYHSIEPFLVNSAMREELWQQFQQFSIKCYEFSDATPEKHQQILDELIDYRINVQKKLYKVLFVDVTL